jgi:hypothetical protein
VTPRFSFLQAEAVFYRGMIGSQPYLKEILWKILAAKFVIDSYCAGTVTGIVIECTRFPLVPTTATVYMPAGVPPVKPSPGGQPSASAPLGPFVHPAIASPATHINTTQSDAARVRFERNLQKQVENASSTRTIAAVWNLLEPPPKIFGTAQNTGTVHMPGTVSTSIAVVDADCEASTRIWFAGKIAGKKQVG